jgi:hypothetical protein
LPASLRPQIMFIPGARLSLLAEKGPKAFAVIASYFKLWHL